MQLTVDSTVSAERSEAGAYRGCPRPRTMNPGVAHNAGVWLHSPFGGEGLRQRGPPPGQSVHGVPFRYGRSSKIGGERWLSGNPSRRRRGTVRLSRDARWHRCGLPGLRNGLAQQRRARVDRPALCRHLSSNTLNAERPAIGGVRFFLSMEPYPSQRRPGVQCSTRGSR